MFLHQQVHQGEIYQRGLSSFRKVHVVLFLFQPVFLPSEQTDLPPDRECDADR